MEDPTPTEIIATSGEWKWYHLVLLATGATAGLIALGWLTQEKEKGDSESNGPPMRGRPAGRAPSTDDQSVQGQKQLMDFFQTILGEVDQAERFVAQQLDAFVSNAPAVEVVTMINKMCESLLQKQIMLDSLTTPVPQIQNAKKILTQRIQAVLHELDDASDKAARSAGMYASRGFREEDDEEPRFALDE